MNEKTRFRGVQKAYIRWPLYLIIPLAVVTLLVFMTDVKAGVISAVGTGFYAIAVFVLYRKYSTHIVRDMIVFSRDYKSVEQQQLELLDVPYAVMDIQGKLVWSNAAFQRLTDISVRSRKGIEKLFPELDPENLPSVENGKEKEIHVVFDDRRYRAWLRLFNLEEMMEEDKNLPKNVYSEHHIISLFLYDETELGEIKEELAAQRSVIGLAYIDNYDEALENLEDVRKTLLIAMVERRISRYVSRFNGLVKNLEKDKYLLVLNQKTLEQIAENRFQILEDVKSVNIGNDMSVTLSIGIGMNGENILQNYEYSRAAIEMALGRGGDQAVIKDGKNNTFFGGKTPQFERTTRVRARVKAQALQEIISAQERLVIMGHKITDVDALGAAIGIYRAGRTLEKSVHIVINDPSASIKPLISGFLDNPEYEADMFVDSQRAVELVDQNTAVIVVDTNKPSYTECEELLRRAKTIVVLDHHRRGSEVIENAVLSYVEPYASSTCEMVSEILQYFPEELRMKSIEADCLYAGILIDTNNFTTRSGVRTFEAAAYLRRSGADVTRVRKMLRDNIDSYKARAEAVWNAEIYRDCYAISVCPGEGLESPTVVGAQAANELLNIAGVKASFVLTEFNNEVYISARAIDEVNVQIMMEKMGGGGHLNIAGAQSKASVEETRETLKHIIDEFEEETAAKNDNQA